MTATVGDAFDRAARRLAAAGVDSPRLDARLLVGRVVDGGAASATGFPERRLTAAQHRRLGRLVARRAAREPMARILGGREFWSLTFKVTADTLIPRPDSETVVEAALAWAAPRRPAPRSILDLGTGTGCLLLALLSELPEAHGIGTDVSADALRTARHNARALGFGRRARFVLSDWGAGIDGQFDLIVANPPYVADTDISRLAPEVARFEPRLALSGGPDGLAAYRAIAPRLAGFTRPDGAVFLEVGAGQADPVTRILRSHGLKVVDIKGDLAGIPRCIIATPQQR